MATITSPVPTTTRGPRVLALSVAVGLIAAALFLFIRTSGAPVDVPASDVAPAISSVAETTTSSGDACTLRRSTSGGVLAGFETADRCAPPSSGRLGGPIP